MTKNMRRFRMEDDAWQVTPAKLYDITLGLQLFADTNLSGFWK